jgi:hypothetical protein
MLSLVAWFLCKNPIAHTTAALICRWIINRRASTADSEPRRMQHSHKRHWLSRSEWANSLYVLLSNAAGDTNCTQINFCANILCAAWNVRRVSNTLTIYTGSAIWLCLRRTRLPSSTARGAHISACNLLRARRQSKCTWGCETLCWIIHGGREQSDARMRHCGALTPAFLFE